jgi:hypothetical protein
MKANYVEFTSKLTIKQLSDTFRAAVQKRPLKLRALRTSFFTPTQAADPFDSAAPGELPEFEVGSTIEFPMGPDPAGGTLILSCVSRVSGTYAALRGASNLRGRPLTNSLMEHVLSKLIEADPNIDPVRSSGRL